MTTVVDDVDEQHKQHVGAAVADSNYAFAALHIAVVHQDLILAENKHTKVIEKIFIFQKK